MTRCAGPRLAGQARTRLLKGRKPQKRILAKLLDHLPHEIDRRGSSRDDGELLGEPLQVQLTHGAVTALFDQKAARARLQLILDETEFPLRQMETLDVVLTRGIC